MANWTAIYAGYIRYCYLYGIQHFLFRLKIIIDIPLKDLPISSIIGAIRNVTPINMRHMSSNKQAVAIIVQRAR